MLLDDDGTLHLQGAQIEPPPNWQPTADPDTLACMLPECLHRRYSRRQVGGALEVWLHCFLKRGDCPGDCEARTPIPPLRTVETEQPDGTVTVEQVRVTPLTPHLHDRPTTPWVITPPEAQLRPDLQAIQESLPPHEEGRDRRFTIEPDGSIVYEREEGVWEPPRDITGFERDPEDKWRFRPLWPICRWRHQIGVRYPNCGCLGIVMRCKQPQHVKYLEKLKHTDCQACPLRSV